MNELTEVQIIEQHGQPAFAVIPWDEFEAIEPTLKRHRALRDGIPHAVVERIALEDVHPVRAWREHLGMEQSAVAARAGMKQPALALGCRWQNPRGYAHQISQGHGPDYRTDRSERLIRGRSA